MTAGATDRTVAHEGGRLQALASRLAGSPAFWALLVVAIASFPIARALKAELPPPLPVLGTVPAFSLTDQHGESFGGEDLRGKVWVAGFVFTRCPTVCPAITAKMFDLQHHARGLGEAFHLVSFSIDPAYDSPEVLARYARSHRASSTGWTFLTGSSEEVQGTVVRGFKIAVTKAEDSTSPESIVHGTHLVLVDGELRIRGYYDTSDADAMKRLLRDAGLLANRGA